MYTQKPSSNSEPTNLPVNTFNKVWILPDQAQVFENGKGAFVTKSTLKVMLDEDYAALLDISPLLLKKSLEQGREAAML